MSEPTDNLKETLKANPDMMQEALAKVLELNPKQKGVLFKQIFKTALPSTATFYHQKFALQIMPDLKEMMETGCVLEYCGEDFPDWKLKTLYLYINQAIQYAGEFMDDEQDSIKLFRKRIEVLLRPKKNKVIVKFKHLRGPTTPLKARRIKAEDYVDDDEAATNKSSEPVNGSYIFMEELMAWMESEPNKGEKFEKTNLNLSDEDVSTLVGMFDTDEQFGLKVNDRKSFLVRKL